MLQSHGGDIYRNKIEIDFSVNINPAGIQPEVLAAVQQAAVSIDCYPDMHCEALGLSVSQFENVPKENLIFSNGAAELFFPAAFAVKPKKALLLSPTFSEYERALRAVDAEIDYYGLEEEKDFQIGEDILEQITPGVDMVFLCNPNNPTGQVTERDLIEQIAKKCRQVGAILIVDECFVGFLNEPERYTVKELAAKYPNLLIVRAFTKLFCMPGLRLGYGICQNRELLKKMRLCMQSWNVSLPAQAGGVAALADCAGYLGRTKALVESERKYLIENLSACGYHVYGSKANYIFFKDKRGTDEKSLDSDLYKQALSAGFLIRDCANYRGLAKGYYRIAVRTREDNERFITWLRKL